MGHATTKRQLDAYLKNLDSIIATLDETLLRINQYLGGTLQPAPAPLPPKSNEINKRDQIAKYCHIILSGMIEKKNQDGNPDKSVLPPYDPKNDYQEQLDQLLLFSRHLRNEFDRKVRLRSLVALRKKSVRRMAANLPDNAHIIDQIGYIFRTADFLEADQTGQKPQPQPTDPRDADTENIEKALLQLLGRLYERKTVS